MATIHDLIEISGPAFNQTLTFENGGLLDVVDNVEKIGNSGDPDTEFNNGDTLIIGGTAFTIDEIYHPDDGNSQITSANGVTAIDDRGDDNADLLILQVSHAGQTRYFLIPSDRLGDMPNISSIRLGKFDDASGNDATLTGFADNDTTICFTRGVRIKTMTGERPVETLSMQDMVLTMDNGYQPIRWIGSRVLSRDVLRGNPDLLPVRIAASALGPDLPQRDLLVSRQHRILLRSKIARNMFGCPEVLVAAKDLVFLPGVEEITEMDRVEYWHFMFDKHQVVYAEGAAAESLFTGPEALRAVGADAAREIFAIMPELALIDMRIKGHMARPELTGAHARELALRHAQRNRSVFEKL